eukprot:CAMPEP_0206478404 /NCGR_PEP_ID=MMETSP0324_2-20121206/36001_1 /ASSEMBLY_ACC=CAM_ASM_000836 /TAXON_ID=2866 /ORGANISM="Crypthecodinium cohnii, Strain Seligo" /LENGTH=78 /DNA_ID=CAMNT_0053954639 /DNA_START=252 /DNA_END=488 /DNA_ORIENTATION=-
MGGMEQAHLTPQAVLRVPSVQVESDVELLWNILDDELEHDEPAQQLAALNKEQKSSQHEACADKAHKEKEDRAMPNSH